MALPKRKVFITFGSSNMQGLKALLSDVPAGDFSRWTGVAAPPAAPPLPSYQRPTHFTVPGVRIYTQRRPYSLNSLRQVTASAGGPPTTITHDGAASGAAVDSWIYMVRSAGTGPAATAQGQVKKVTGVAGNVITVAAPAMSPVPAVGDTISILADSHTIASSATVILNGTSYTKVTKTGTTPAFVAGDLDRFVMFPEEADTDPSAFYASAKVKVVDSANVITLDRLMSAASVAAGKMMVVLSGPNQAKDFNTLQPPNAILQDLTFYLDEKAPCFLTGTDYCNYNGWVFHMPRMPGGASFDPPTINCLPELTWRLRQKFDKIDVVNLGISSATAAPFFQWGAPTFAPIPMNMISDRFFGWMHDWHGNDFSPGSDKNEYQVLASEIVGCRTLLAAEGFDADFDTAFVNLADNEQFYEQLVAKNGESLRIIRDALRVLTGNPQMKYVMAGPSQYGTTTSYDGDVRDMVYAQLRKVSEDDPYTTFFDTRDAAYAKSSDGSHYSAVGQMQLGKGFFAAYEDVTNKANDAARLKSELLTLSTLRTRVRRRYERSDVGNDATASQIDQFINDSIRELYNTLGDDKAWFLRRVEQIDLSSGLFPGTINLPRQVKRLLRIEPVACPGRALTWKGLSHTDEGRTQITLHESTTGPFNMHFIMLTKDLVADTDVALIPEEYTELVVVLTCKRLTECAGNTAMAQYYIAESARLWQQVKRSCQLHDRMRQGQLEMLGAYDSWTNSAWAGGDEWGL